MKMKRKATKRSRPQEDVEAALKTGLEAMASAIGDALKIKIDVRSGGEEEEGEEEEEEIEVGDEELMETGAEDTGSSEGDESVVPGKVDYQTESLNRNALVEKVMKRVAARLVKESKKKRRR